MQRIEQALPLDPASDAGQGYLPECKLLLVPFSDSLDDDMEAEATILAGSITDQSIEHPIKKELLELIEAAKRAFKKE